MASVSLQTGLKALMAAQSVLDTVGNNIANANTPGYSRQRVDLRSGMSIQLRGLLIGTGVNADAVRRTVDSIVERRLLSQYSIGGRLSSLLDGMSTVEALVGEPDGYGLTAKLDGFFGGLSSLSASPADGVLQDNAVQSGVDMTQAFNSLAANLGSMVEDMPLQLQALVNEVNNLSGGIAALNSEISAIESTGVSANDLRDQRGQLLNELAGLVDITAVEKDNGQVRVLLGGNSLVGGTKVSQLSYGVDGQGELSLSLDGVQGEIEVTGGKIGGLLKLADGFVSEFQQELDELAQSLIFELNKVHSTGLPTGGAFGSVAAGNLLVDGDGDGKFTDELLADAGLPFPIQSGELYVNITDEASGEVQKHLVAIDAEQTTVGDLLDQLNGIPLLSAEVNAYGQVQIAADSGYGVDFSAHLEAQPDTLGSFGGGQASLGTTQGEPFALAPGDTLDLFVPGVGINVNLSFAAGDFENIGAASAEELAAVVNADPGAQAAGITAAAQGGQLFLQTVGAGSSHSFDVVGGSALAALGLAGFAGASIGGHDNAVDVQISGVYSGDDNDNYTFTPLSDGTVGTTPGLLVEVRDEAGALIATLDVGAGYEPGTELPVGDGLAISLGLGELSASQGDQFELAVVADSDTTDLLAALGINSLLVGSSAADIAVRQDIVDDSSLLASSATGAVGDNQLLLKLLDVEQAQVEALGGQTLGGSYSGMIARIGFEISSARAAEDASQALTDSLEERRAAVSGVNLDEELVEMLKFEQAFAAASQFISTVNQLNDELLAIL